MGIRERIGALFRPNEAKINPAYQGMITYSDVPKPLLMPRNLKSYMKEGYAGNDTIFKSVSYIARNGAAIPPKLYTDASRDKEIESHPILDLLNRPNNEQSGIQYREAVLTYKLVTGNAFQYALRPGKSGAPRELWTLRPDLVKPLASKTRGIVGYKYEYMEEPIAPELIGHTKYFNPDNENIGLSPIEIAGIFADQQKYARIWNLSLLQNSARPPGAWTVPTPLSKNDRERLERSLKEKLQGYRNAGTPPVLDAGLTWESMGLSPADLDYIPGMKYNSVQIANIYNMPPQLVGDDGTSTYNNVKEAKAASYTEAIFPELDDFYACLTMWLAPFYPDLKNAVVYYDKTSVEVVADVVQEARQAAAERATKLWTLGLCTLNEARELAGLAEVDGGDVFRIGGVLVLESDLDKYAEQSLTTPAAPPMPKPEPIQAAAQPTNGAKPAAQPQKPAKSIISHDKKNIDWIAPDADKDIALLKSQGHKTITWMASPGACDECEQNDQYTVELGQTFPNGGLLPPLHPNCECTYLLDGNTNAKKTTSAPAQESNNELQRASLVRSSEQDNAAAYREYTRLGQ